VKIFCKKKGFTLVETIVSNVILCGAVVTLGAVGTLCLTQAKLNSQYETAAALADRQLSFIDYMGVDTFVQKGQMEGEFEGGQVKYTWQANIASLGLDNLYAVTLQVTWMHRNRQYKVVVDTRLNGAGSAVQILEGSTESGVSGQ
jgi:type II secretory pathway pseudopilin PulG